MIETLNVWDQIRTNVANGVWLSRWTAICVSLVWTSCGEKTELGSTGKPPNVSELRIESLQPFTERLAVAYEDFTFGYETLSSVPDTLVEYRPELLEFEGRLNVGYLEEVVSKTTGYECRIVARGIVVMPKAQHLGNGLSPIALRIGHWPEANDLDAYDVLVSVTSTSSQASIVLDDLYSLKGGPCMSGRVSMKSGQSMVGELLCEMARQINARGWQMYSGGGGGAMVRFLPPSGYKAVENASPPKPRLQRPFPYHRFKLPKSDIGDTPRNPPSRN